MSKLKTKTLPKEYDWHAKESSLVLSELGVTEQGLSQEEVGTRRIQSGANAFTEAHTKSFVVRLIEQFKNPLTIALLVASIVTFVLEEFIDSAVIAFALFIAVIVGVIQEGRASRAFDRLASSQVHMAIVIRGGKRHEVSADTLVPGDVVLLQSGMQVPADMRLFTAKHLEINEATLTGEWQAVTKHTEVIAVGEAFADRINMAWKGTFVADGYGMGVIVATGDNTEVGKLAMELSTIEEEITPLQAEMQKVSRIMFGIILALVVIIFVLGLIRGEEFGTMLITAIAIAVAAIPEGLPAAVTIVLAIGMESLLRRGGLVRNLLAAETLGSTTYVLTDKTGTLTEGRMAVVNLIFSDDSDTQEWNTHPLAEELFTTALCATDAFIDEDEEKKETFTIKGEPMERAMLQASLDMGLTTAGIHARSDRVDYLSFTSENRFAAGLCTAESGYQLCVNGAPEYLLEASTAVHVGDGTIPMDRVRRQYFNTEITRLTKQGMRIIGVAYRATADGTIPTEPQAILSDLVFMGLVIFHDPVREGVADAIAGVHRAGAQVRLVTGDNPETALSIARAVGIARPHDVALVGKDIAHFSDDELVAVIQTTHVFARVLPRQKLRLAQVLQRRGEIVAMTGDGINDAPALQKANIGIALGSGTEVAKEASDLVLVDDTFETIHAAIEEGRRIISNLRKIIGYMLATSVSEAVLIGGALLVAAPIPIVPVQILWANLIEGGLMSVAFAFERGDRRAMERRPHDIYEEGILSHEMLKFIGMVIGILSVLLLSLYGYLLYREMPLEQLRSVMFLMISIDSLFIAFSFRSLTTPIWNIPLISNIFFLISFSVSTALLLVVMTVPFMQFLLSYEPLSFFNISLIILYGVLSLLTIEVAKWVFFERRK